MKSEGIVNAVKEFRDYILYQSGSESTAKNYGSAVASFLAAFPDASRPADISAEDIVIYLLTHFPNLSSRRNAHSAIKKFYQFKSKNGFIKLMQGCDNIKHRCVLMCAFDAGMRVSEVKNLKLRKLNFELMQIHIEQGKGRKDRIVKLTKVFARFLLQYIEEYKPVEYLFNGQFSLQYSTRSCEEILTKLCIKVGMPHHKFHELRHGFAMALYENGYSLETIRDLLGHATTKTTEIYARKNNIIIQGTQSPLEQIFTEHQLQKSISQPVIHSPAYMKNINSPLKEAMI